MGLDTEMDWLTGSYKVALTLNLWSAEYSLYPIIERPSRLPFRNLFSDIFTHVLVIYFFVIRLYMVVVTGAAVAVLVS